MKKIIYAAIAAAILTSCQKDPSVNITVKEKTKTVEATAPYGFVWSNDDRIVVNGLKSALTEIDIEDDNKCSFSFNVGVETPHCAVFPDSLFSSWNADKKTATVKAPSTQKFTGEENNSEAFLLLGRSDELGTIELENALSYVSITPEEGEVDYNIVTIIVSEPSGNALSGNFTAIFGEDGCRIESGKQDGSTITVRCGEGYGLKLGTPIVFAVPAGTYPDGLQLDIYDSNGSFQIRRFPSEGSFVAEAGKTKEESFTYKPISSLDLGEIPNAEVWNSFAARISEGDDFSGKTLRLTGNINAESLDFADGTFNGKLDGAGFSINRSSSSRPLFKTIGKDAEISSLLLMGAVKNLDRPYEWGNAALAQTNLGTVSDVSVNCPADLELNEAVLVGALVAQNGGILKNCSNEGDITLNISVSKAAVLGGGIAAYGHSLTGLASPTGMYYAEAGSCAAGVFENCRNTGAISVTVKSGVGGVSSFGGICGIAEYDGVVFKGCTNSGAISRISDGEESTGSSASLGGILGRFAGTFATDWNDYGAQQPINIGKGYTVTLENCSNSGTILCKCRHNGCVNKDGSGARFDNVGGIVGAAVSPDGAKSSITSCSNEGTVTGGWANTVNTPVLGGIVGLAQNIDINDCTVGGKIESLAGTCVGAAGAFAGFVAKNVNVGGSSTSSAAIKMSKLNNNLVMWWGLALGYVKSGSASISGAEFSGSAEIDGTVLDLNSGNFTGYLYNSASPVKPSTSNCTWSK